MDVAAPGFRHVYFHQFSGKNVRDKYGFPVGKTAKAFSALDNFFYSDDSFFNHAFSTRAVSLILR